MASLASAEEPAFQYDAIGRDGRAVRDIVHAADERAALRRLSADGLVVTRLQRARTVVKSGADRDLKLGERVLVMRQLALMLKAGVSMLEAIETVAAGIEAVKGRRQFEALITALKRGEPFGAALAEHVPGFPFYVYALANVGEASGRIDEVLRDAAEQMAYEDRLRREFINALTYPAFLACAGLAAMTFIFVEIVPRFSAMLGPNMDKMPAISRLVLTIGNFVSGHLLLVGLAGAGLIGVVVLTLGNAAFRTRLYAVGHNVPVVGRLLKMREIATWARLTSFSLTHGVELLGAMSLARQATPPGALRSGLEALETDLKAGVDIDASLARNTSLTAMDLSLLRAGQKSGALASMFGFLADRYDDELKDAMKRLTSLLEPAAVGLVAIIVGVIALSLVLALSSIYETIN